MDLVLRQSWGQFANRWYLLIILTGTIYATSGEPRTRFIGLNQGLSQSSITAISQDASGFIWLGTQDGLNIYDGYKIRVVRNDPNNPNTLSNNFILCMLLDTDDAMWVGTRQGLNRYYSETGCFERFYAGDPSGVEGDVIRAMGHDRMGRVWILTSAGLQLFNRDTKTFSNPVSNSQGTWLFTPGKTGFWLSDEARLLYFDPISGVMDPPITSLPKGRINYVVESTSQAGSLYIGFASSGVIKYSLGERSYIPLNISTKDLPNDPAKRVEIMIEDSQGNLWVATRAGVVRIPSGTMNAEKITHEHSWALFEDKSRMMWLGAMTGVHLYNPKTQYFEHYTNVAAIGENKYSNDVETVFKDSSGNVWVSIYDQGLFRYLHESDTFEKIDLQGIDPAGVSHIREETSGALVLSSRGGGVSRFQPTTGELERVLPNDQVTITKYNNSHLTRAGDFWVGCYEEGVLHQQPDGTYKHYTHVPGDTSSLTGDTIWCMLEGDNGKMWAGTYSGLNLIDPHTETVRRYQYNQDNSRTISNNGIGAMCYDREGQLWLATDAGLNRFINGVEAFERITTRDGLKNDFIYGIVLDDDGYLWLSTNSGLVKFNPRDRTFIDFDYMDGLQHNEFSSGSYHRASDGQFLFGGINGVTAFYPSEIIRNPAGPPVFFNELRLFNKVVSVSQDASAILKQPLAYTKSLTFSHDQVAFSFNFAALHFQNPKAVRYAYKLEGFHDKWIETDMADRRASFTNLNPGVYTLKVKASRHYGFWTPKPAELVIKVMPAFWKSRLAFSFYSLAVMGLLVGYVMSHRRRRRILARLVAERTAELAAKNEALDNSIRELETLDDIVVNINREVQLENLLNTLLEQGRLLIPSAQKGNFLMFDATEGLYRVYATLGFSMEDVGSLVCSFEVMVDRYIRYGERIGEGLHLVREVGTLPSQQLVRGLPTPLAMLVMEISVEGNLQGLLILDNYESAFAFDDIEPSSLARFRNHAITAVAKASSFDALEQMNQSILTRQKQLLSQERMASLGTLTAGVAHELKNPLNFVNGLSAISLELIEEARDSGQTDHRQMEILNDLARNLDIIHKNGDRANAIVESMMTLSRNESVRSEQVNISKLIEETVKLVYNGMRAQKLGFDVKICQNFDPLPDLPIIPQNFTRVMINLLNNALDSLMEKHEYQSKSFEPELQVSTHVCENRVEISVFDNGVGIPEHVQPRIFDYFFTTKSPDQGNVGLGLSISYDIIKQDHKGLIRAESVPGDYACFTLSIPLVHQIR